MAKIKESPVKLSGSQLAKELHKLTTQERKIYDSIMRIFPETNPLSAIDHAIQGGVKFEYQPK